MSIGRCSRQMTSNSWLCTSLHNNSDPGEYVDRHGHVCVWYSNATRKNVRCLLKYSRRGPSMIGRHYHARACSFAHCGGGENYIFLFSEPLMMKKGGSRCCSHVGVDGQRTLQHFNAATIKGVFSSQIQPLEQSEHVAGASQCLLLFLDQILSFNMP